VLLHPKALTGVGVPRDKAPCNTAIIPLLIKKHRHSTTEIKNAYKIVKKTEGKTYRDRAQPARTQFRTVYRGNPRMMLKDGEFLHRPRAYQLLKK
jgi:hypothetical protein